MGCVSVEVHLYSQSSPVVIDGVKNTYTKGPLYCVWTEAGPVYKFPVKHIFRIKEISSVASI